MYEGFSANRISVVAVSVTTNATGSAFQAFGSQACKQLDLINQTGTMIEYQRGGAGSTVQIPSPGSRMILGLNNASDIAVRRVDQLNTQVTLGGEAFV